MRGKEPQRGLPPLYNVLSCNIVIHDRGFHMGRSSRRAALPVVPVAPQATGVFDQTEHPKSRERAKSTGPRAGKKAVPFWMPEPAKRQLDIMTIEQDTTIQALLTEAVNGLFTKYQKPPIA